MPLKPNFIIAGAMRCGTTSLSYYLRQHPEVFFSRPKELHYFDFHFHRGPDWYNRHFSGASDQLAIGEATPNYLLLEDALQRMREYLPEARIIVLLRNPIDRAFSHYWHNRQIGKEKLEFLAALAAEPSRAKLDRTSRSFYSYAEKGDYQVQLERLFSLYDRQQVLVLLTEEMERDPAGVFSRVCVFLGIDSSFSPPALGSRVNRHMRIRWPWLRNASKPLPRILRSVIAAANYRKDVYEPMPLAARRVLADRYQHKNRDLADLLGVSLALWE